MKKKNLLKNKKKSSAQLSLGYAMALDRRSQEKKAIIYYKKALKA